MNHPFDDELGVVVVPAELFGPSGSVVLRLALDTGATRTMVNVGLLVLLGYDPSMVSDRIEVTTGSGVEYVPSVVVDRISTLGQQRDLFPVLAHTLPVSAHVDGLLGLDYMHGQTLTLDFRGRTVALQ